METPDTIKKDAANYQDRAWEDYTPQELGNWVHLLLKRARHRADTTKRQKDLADAQAYLDMLRAHVAEALSKE